MSCPIESIIQQAPEVQARIDEVEGAVSFHQLIWAAWRLGILLAAMIVEEILRVRAEEPTTWPPCPQCARKLWSKGFRPRQMQTILGMIHWKRRIGRCPNGCGIGQLAPFDEELGIQPHEASSLELKQMGCLFAIFVPFETASLLLERLWKVRVSDNTIWQWVQQFGAKAIQQLEERLADFEPRDYPNDLLSPAQLQALQALIGADGVFAPFRPHGGSPHGKTVWQEVKIGVIARLQRVGKGSGKWVSRLAQRRLVAYRGDTNNFTPRLLLEGLQQQMCEARQTIWVSDGSRGLWRIFQGWFSWHAIGVLDFYHAAENLWKGASSWLDGRTNAARQWFTQARHRLRHGQLQSILNDLTQTLQNPDLDPKARKAVTNLKNYLTTHVEHMNYEQLKKKGIPLGSGFVESACKWLIQQRFKCVGMRWSEQGFDHLLHLRLLWVNQRFDTLFVHSPID